jgi:hypothetical protein
MSGRVDVYSTSEGPLTPTTLTVRSFDEPPGQQSRQIVDAVSVQHGICMVTLQIVSKCPVLARISERYAAPCQRPVAKILAAALRNFHDLASVRPTCDRAQRRGF